MQNLDEIVDGGYTAVHSPTCSDRSQLWLLPLLPQGSGGSKVVLGGLCKEQLINRFITGCDPRSSKCPDRPGQLVGSDMCPWCGYKYLLDL